MQQAVTWPNGTQCAVMMTFDLDGESPWIHRDPALAERPLHMSMGSYGPKTGMPRILDLLDRYGLKTCFFIPGWIFNWLGHPQIIGRPSRMRMVERLIQRILDKGDVWWPRPLELARFWLDRSD